MKKELFNVKKQELNFATHGQVYSIEFTISLVWIILVDQFYVNQSFYASRIPERFLAWVSGVHIKSNFLIVHDIQSNVLSFPSFFNHNT